jgi:hypothetical protein
MQCVKGKKNKLRCRLQLKVRFLSRFSKFALITTPTTVMNSPMTLSGETLY